MVVGRHQFVDGSFSGLRRDSEQQTTGGLSVGQQYHIHVITFASIESVGNPSQVPFLSILGEWTLQGYNIESKYRANLRPHEPP